MAGEESRPGGTAHWADAGVDRQLADRLRLALATALDPEANDEGRSAPVRILVDFKDAGGRLGDAYETLGSLRDESEDDSVRGDFIDDLLDGVWGWCSPDHWLWRDVVYPCVVRCDEAACTGEVHEQVVAWSKEVGLDWCRIRGGYAFVTETDADRFRARWGDLLARADSAR